MERMHENEKDLSRQGSVLSCGNFESGTISHNLKAALWYAQKKHWHIFPCVPRKKIPLTKHGFLDATTDPSKIREWWDKNPHANVAVACGFSGIFVLDIDVKPDQDIDGNETLQDLAQGLGPLPYTVEQLTGGGGRQLFFKAFEGGGSSTNVRSGLDVRGESGYVVLPPSVHPSGHRYEWEVSSRVDEVPIAEIEPFPGVLGIFATAVASATETPLELPAGLTLGTVAAACQGKLVVQVKEGYSEPVNLWITVALDPGNRKSAVLVEASRPLTTWEDTKKLEIDPMIKEARSKQKNQEARLKSLRARYGKAKQEELEEIEAASRAEENALTEVPVIPKVWTQDITPEHLGTEMFLHDERIAILSAEGGIFDIIGGRYSNGIPNLDIFLQSHSGDPIRVDRGSRDPIYLQRPTLSMVLSPQPEVLKNIAQTPGFRGKGLLARFLYLLPKSKLGYRTLETDPVQQEIRARYEGIIHQLLNLPTKDESGRSVPYVLHLSRAAYDEWLDFSRVVEKNMREGGRFENITDWAGKLPGTASRIAGLLHCIEYPTQPWNNQISLETMQQALAFASICASHALKVFDLMGADESMKGARKIWRWIKRGKFQSFTKRDCYNALKGRFPRVADIEPFLGLLEERHYIASETKKQAAGLQQDTLSTSNFRRSGYNGLAAAYANRSTFADL